MENRDPKEQTTGDTKSIKFTSSSIK